MQLKLKEGTEVNNVQTSPFEDERPVVQQIFKPGKNAPMTHTNVVAVDCEMVEVDRWGEALARCSIVNYYGQILMDKYVIPDG